MHRYIVVDQSDESEGMVRATDVVAADPVMAIRLAFHKFTGNPNPLNATIRLVAAENTGVGMPLLPYGQLLHEGYINPPGTSAEWKVVVVDIGVLAEVEYAS